MQLKQEQGFTLIEVLICLSLLLLLAILAPRLFPHFSVPSEKKLPGFEWTLCIEQMEMEFREAMAASISNNKLVLRTKNKEIVEYVVSGNYLIRRVNGQGNEIVLQNIRNISYDLQTLTLQVQVLDLQKKTHTGTIMRFSPFEETL